MKFYGSDRSKMFGGAASIVRVAWRGMAALMLCVAAWALAGCHGPEPEAHPIVRLDQDVARFGTLTASEQEAMIDSLRPELDALFTVLGQGAPDAADVLWWSQTDAVRVFQPDVDSVFPSISGLEHSLGGILDSASKEGLDLPPLLFATVTWGRPQPIVRVDSVVLIALNHYLGSDYAGYSHWEAFRRAEKRSCALPYDLAATIVATQYPFDGGDSPTLLSWMLYEGVLVEARMRLVPDAMLTQALGYTPDQLELLEDHTTQIWEEMALKKMIYETNPAVIDRLLTSAPNTPLLQGRAPGRTARYIGYKIVNEYKRKHPATTLAQMLSPEFYSSSSTLIESGF